MSFIVILTIVLGAGVGVLAIFLVRMVVTPKQLAAVNDMIKQGRLAAAARIVRGIIAKTPTSAPAHYYLGLVYLAEEKPELALMEFKTVNQIGQFGEEVPEVEFRTRIAGMFEKFGQIEEALKEHILLTKLESANAEHYYNCGRIFDDRGKTDVGVKYLRKALELDPRMGKAHARLGLILYKTKHPVESRAELEMAIKLQPDFYESYYFLGKLLKESNDYTAALLTLEKALRSPELKVKALVERGGCYMSMGNLDKAVIELERAIKLVKDEGAPEALYGRYFLAMCFEKMRNLDRAIEQWEKIYARKPGFRDVAEKLTQYQEYRSDDKMKDYLTCGREEFIDLCKAVTQQALQLNIRDVSMTPNGVDLIAVENDSEKWMGTKKMPRLLRFLRVSEMLDDSAVRSLLDQMKKLSIIRGSIITSSSFNRAALEFGENRAVELVAKDQLQELLSKTTLPSSPHR
ncbi:MAG: tetratricopeptide repeat protein [Treponema sp.]|nr:tetratricopeptide repeat protein [Treponema sp.]